MYVHVCVHWDNGVGDSYCLTSMELWVGSVWTWGHSFGLWTLSHNIIKGCLGLLLRHSSIHPESVSVSIFPCLQSSPITLSALGLFSLKILLRLNEGASISQPEDSFIKSSWSTHPHPKERVVKMQASAWYIHLFARYLQGGGCVLPRPLTPPSHSSTTCCATRHPDRGKGDSPTQSEIGIHHNISINTGAAPPIRLARSHNVVGGRLLSSIR